MIEVHIDENPGGDIPSVGYKLIVTDYRYEDSWNASGFAIGLADDGTCCYWYIGHCSCFGPWDKAEPETFDINSESAIGDGPLPDRLIERFKIEVEKLMETKG